MADAVMQDPDYVDEARPTQDSGKHLLLALLIAAVIVFGARQLADHFLRPAVAPIVAAKTVPTADASATDSAEDERLAVEARVQRQRREEALLEQDRARREQKKADVMRARDEAAVAAQAEEARKDAAWQHFFKKSKRCDAPTDDAIRVDCSNEYIRAREKFDKLYADGKLH
ncbi:MAG: hypothetical protein JWN23_1675 [Rhodocyclales bacterium]|nr:hypothetical protein [Rhodocyclales bacterium]